MKNQQEPMELFQKESVQQFQDSFCRLNRVYMILVGKDRTPLTELTGSPEEKDYVESRFPAELRQELLASFSDEDAEDVIAMTGDVPSSMLRGVAARDAAGAVAAVWIVMGIDETLVPPEERPPRSIALTTEERFDEVVSFLVLCTNNQIRWNNAQEQLQEQSHEVGQQLRELQQQSFCADVVTRMLTSMESSRPMDQVTDYILAEAGKYLHATSCHLLLLPKQEEESPQLLCEWAADKDGGMSGVYEELSMAQVPFLNGRSYIISAGTVMPGAFASFFEQAGISAGIFLPVDARENQKMYLCIVDRQEQRIWTDGEQDFASDVKRMIHIWVTKHLAKDALESSRSMLSELLENVGCALCIYDMATQEPIYENKMFSNMKLTEEDRKRFRKDVLGSTSISGRLQEYRARESGIYLEISYTDMHWLDGQAVRLASIYDISRRKHYQEKVMRQADEDHLTGLWNRMRFIEDLEKLIHSCVRAAEPSALLCLDLNDFAQMNHELGQQIGNLLLKRIATTLSHMVGVGDHCYRLDGDQFAILLTSKYYDKLEKLQAAIVSRFENTWQIEGREYSCTMNVGVIRIPKDGITVDTIMRRVDIALKRAEEKGRNCVSYYNSHGSGDNNQPVEIEQNLRLAVSQHRSEFELYYQPIFAMPSGTCVGAEALLRWNSPVIGRKNPAEFLPLAEYLGLMPMLEQIVLQMACKKCKNWHNMGHPDYEITVNLSPSQLMYKHMPDYIRRALQESGLEPSNLVLDVTGYDNPRELRHIRQVIREISSLGVKIALDDFGTEFTSFRSMEMIAPDMIKLDRSCISKLGQDAFTDAYVRSAIELADLLKIQTLAKGVEEKEQLDELSGMQLTMAQGYVFDRPMPEEEFEAKYVYGDIG